jgi:uncharacterized protein YjbJ (UPF0337 family)
MGLEDKGRNVVIHHLGGAREQAGRLTGNGGLQREGQAGPARAEYGKAADAALNPAAGIAGTGANSSATNTGANVTAGARKLQDGLGER